MRCRRFSLVERARSNRAQALGSYGDRLVTTTPYRSALMKRVRRKDTSLEQSVRRCLSRLGARYRLNVRDLPGRPDIANKSRHKAIFVHGCFWHYHEGCARGRIPKRNSEFWEEKLVRNRERDAEKSAALEARGFDVMTTWECEIGNEEELQWRLERFWTAHA